MRMSDSFLQENEAILEAYVKSWVSGALDKAATRGSVAFTLVLHHLSSFVFISHESDKPLLRNKLVKSLLRDYARKKQHEVCSFSCKVLKNFALPKQESFGI